MWRYHLLLLQYNCGILIGSDFWNTLYMGWKNPRHDYGTKNCHEEKAHFDKLLTPNTATILRHMPVGEILLTVTNFTVRRWVSSVALSSGTSLAVVAITIRRATVDPDFKVRHVHAPIYMRGRRNLNVNKRNGVRKILLLFQFIHFSIYLYMPNFMKFWWTAFLSVTAQRKKFGSLHHLNISSCKKRESGVPLGKFVGMSLPPVPAYFRDSSYRSYDRSFYVETFPYKELHR